MGQIEILTDFERHVTHYVMDARDDYPDKPKVLQQLREAEWTAVADGLPTEDMEWLLLEVFEEPTEFTPRTVIYYGTVCTSRTSLELFLNWDNLILLRWQAITPPKGL